MKYFLSLALALFLTSNLDGACAITLNTDVNVVKTDDDDVDKNTPARFK